VRLELGKDGLKENTEASPIFQGHINYVSLFFKTPIIITFTSQISHQNPS